MSVAISGGSSAAGTALSPKYFEGPVYGKDDVRMHQRYFTYQADAGLVTGKNSNVMFTIDRPAKQVWSYLKDFNLWQNSYGYYYSGVVGDLEGQAFYPTRMHYQVLKVIPEHLITLFQPVPADGSNGGVSPGFHVFMLNEHDGKTGVSVLMSHATQAMGKTEEEALGPWRKQAPESQRFWLEIFIPTLKRLIYESK